MPIFRHAMYARQERIHQARLCAHAFLAQLELIASMEQLPASSAHVAHLPIRLDWLNAPTVLLELVATRRTLARSARMECQFFQELFALVRLVPRERVFSVDLPAVPCARWVASARLAGNALAKSVLLELMAANLVRGRPNALVNAPLIPLVIEMERHLALLALLECMQILWVPPPASCVSSLESPVFLLMAGCLAKTIFALTSRLAFQAAQRTLLLSPLQAT